MNDKEVQETLVDPKCENISIPYKFYQKFLTSEEYCNNQTRISVTHLLRPPGVLLTLPKLQWKELSLTTTAESSKWQQNNRPQDLLMSPYQYPVASQLRWTHSITEDAVIFPLQTRHSWGWTFCPC